MYENCRGAVGIADDVQVFGNEIHMTEMSMRQWNALGKQALNLVSINVLLRSNVVVFLCAQYIPEVKPDLKKVEPIKQMHPPIKTMTEFIPRYGNLLISLHAKYFLLAFKSEGCAQ